MSDAYDTPSGAHGEQGEAPSAFDGQRVSTAEIQLRRVMRALRALSACNQALVHAEGENELLQSICRVVVNIAGYRLAWVGYVVHDAAQSVKPVAHAGFDDGYLERIGITWADSERGRGPTGTAIRTKQPSICRHMTTDPDFAPWREDALRRGYASSIVLPLMRGEEVFGALNIYASEPDAFHSDECSLLGEMAGDMAYGLIALRRREALKESAALYREVFEHVSDALLVVQATGEGRFEAVSMNGSAVPVYGEAPTLPGRAPGRVSLARQPSEAVAEFWRQGLAEARRSEYEEERQIPGLGVRVLKSVAIPIPTGRRDERRLLVVTRDFTDQRREERRVLEQHRELETVVAERTREWAESERRFRNVFETAPFGICIEDWSVIVSELGGENSDKSAKLLERLELDPEAGRRLADSRVIIDVNPRMLEMFGFASSSEITGRSRSMLGAETGADFLREARAFLAGKRDFKSEASFVDARGKVLHCWVGVSFPVRGATAGFALVTIVDISERKRMEEALHKSEEHFRRLFETMAQGVVYQDREGRIISMNPAAERILGRTPEEFTGRTSVDEEGGTVREDGTSFPGLEHPSMVALRTGREVRDVVMGVYNPRERRRRWILVNAMPLTGPGETRPDQVYTIFADITVQMESARRIARQTAVLAGINRIFREALVQSTRDDDAAVFLEVVCGLTGSAMGMVGELSGDGRLDAVSLNRSVWEKCQLPPETLERMRTMEPRGFWARALRSGRGEIVNDAENDPEALRLPEGHTLVKRFLGVPLLSGDKVIGLVGLANKRQGYDDDDIRAVEAVAPAFLEALNRKRAQADVLRLNAELNERARDLEETNRELEAFSYSVSHDLRAPLRGIVGFGSILAEDFGRNLGPEGLACLGHLRDASRRMGELIDDLLELSRAARGELARMPVDLSRIAEEVIQELRRAEPERQVEARIAAGLIAPCDYRLMRAAFENLLGNAWKFSRGRTPAVIEVGAEDAAGERTYFVRDNGAGFNMAYVERLFAPFRRLHSTSEFPGTGIGLATVQRIIHRHGGRIWAEGEVEKGAVFRFTLGRSTEPPGGPADWKTPTK